jgi:hypothetical protein
VVWFFKLQGPVEAVSKHKAEFDAVLQSIRFKEQQPEAIAWTTPAGWRQEPGNSIRYATLRPEGDDKIELSITKLPPSDLLANVNRWRGQLSLPPLAEKDLPKETQTLKIAGVDATLVDITGLSGGKMPPFAGRGQMPPPMNEAPDQGQPAGELPFKYTLPQGWELDSTPRPMRITTFRVSNGGQVAEVAVSSFPGDVGGKLANVNRWREQMGLAKIGENDLARETQGLDVAGEKAYLVDASQPEQGSGPRQRMLAVGLPHARATWFFKMTGPADLVGKQKSAFEAFVKSVAFDGGKGANP